MNDQVKSKIMLEAKTIAVVGLSKKPFRPGHYVPAFLQEKGYRIIPVNPTLKEPVLGETPYPDLSSVPEPVDLVLIFQRSENVPPFVAEAIAIGAKAVWLQQGIYHEAAGKSAADAGLDVVMDACMMVDHRRLM
jgi:predicted CoA-binding protein